MSGKQFFEDLLQGKVSTGPESPTPVNPKRQSLDSVQSEESEVDLLNSMQGSDHLGLSPAPAPAPVRSRPETLEEKIARVMKGIAGSSSSSTGPTKVTPKATSTPSSAPVAAEAVSKIDDVSAGASQKAAPAAASESQKPIAGKSHEAAQQAAVQIEADTPSSPVAELERASASISSPSDTVEAVESSTGSKDKPKKKGAKKGAKSNSGKQGDRKPTEEATAPVAEPAVAPGVVQATLSSSEASEATFAASAAPPTTTTTTTSSAGSGPPKQDEAVPTPREQEVGNEEADEAPARTQPPRRSHRYQKDDRKHAIEPQQPQQQRALLQKDVLNAKDSAGLGDGQKKSQHVSDKKEADAAHGPAVEETPGATTVPNSPSPSARSSSTRLYHSPSKVKQAVVASREAIKKIDLVQVDARVGGLAISDPKPRKVLGATDRTRRDKFHFFGSATTHDENIAVYLGESMKKLSVTAAAHVHGRGLAGHMHEHHSFNAQPRRLSSPGDESPSASPGTWWATVAKQQRHLTSTPTSPSLNVRVGVRIRPFNVGEIRSAARRIVSVREPEGGRRGGGSSEGCSGERTEMGTVVLVNPNSMDASPDKIAAVGRAIDNAEWVKVFDVHHSFWSYDPNDDGDVYATQEDVYADVGKPMVERFLDGANVCCFAYGHTGTGKTHTMMGSLVSTAVKAARAEEDRRDERAHEQSLLMDCESHEETTCHDKHHDHHHHPEGHIVRTESILGSPEAKNEMGALIATLARPDGSFDEQLGLIPRATVEAIRAIMSDPARAATTRVTLAFMEIYNERVRDLLSAAPDEDDTELRIREHPVIGTYVDGVTRVGVTTADEVLKVLLWGTSNRIIATTARNAASSRSHAMVTLEMSPRHISDPALNDTERQGSSIPSSVANNVHSKYECVRLQLVDMAGSESDKANVGGMYNGVKDPKPHSAVQVRQTSHEIDQERTEQRSIRRGLSTLGHILRELARGMPNRGLPFRESTLTWLMKDALSGKCDTTMLATVSPSSTCFTETLHTLKYSQRLMQTLARAKSLSSSSSSSATVVDTAITTAAKKEMAALRASSAATGAAMLQATVADPQQRLARLERHRSPPSRTPPWGAGDGASSKAVGPRRPSDARRPVKPARTAITGGDKKWEGRAVSDEVRSLTANLAEMALELTITRTDLDALKLENTSLRQKMSSGTEAATKQQDDVGLKEALVEALARADASERKAKAAAMEAEHWEEEAAKAKASLAAEKEKVAQKEAALAASGKEAEVREAEDVEALTKIFQGMAATSDADMLRLRAENEALRRELRAVDQEILGAIDAKGSPALKKATARAAARTLKAKKNRDGTNVAPATRSALAAHGRRMKGRGDGK